MKNQIGTRMEEFQLLDALFDKLFPIMRSITGDGYRESTRILSEYLPFDFQYVDSQTEVFDWSVPDEWVFESAQLIDPSGKIIIDASVSNLHVLNYSASVDRYLSFNELRPHLFSIPDKPLAIPYVTSYYERNWGFCISQDQLDKLPRDGDYRAVIKSDFVKGAVQVGTCILNGESSKEFLITSYICHPSLANNELSGPLVQLALYNRIKKWNRRRFSYRFVINPETIGSICNLYLNGKQLRERVVSGAVLTCLGGPAEKISYKFSKNGNSVLDRLIRDQFRDKLDEITTRAYTPVGGSDERQYCSPGFNLPVGQFARTAYGEYDGYHNSLDTKKFMSIDSLISSADSIERALFAFDNGGIWVNKKPNGEPQLSKYDLYSKINSGGKSRDQNPQDRLRLDCALWILGLGDGTVALADIAHQSGLSVDLLLEVAFILEDKGLVEYKN
jgi:aminopeptidase-like protein